MTSAFTPERLMTLAASLRLWLLALLAWWAETFGDDEARARIAHDVARAERGVRGIVVLMALHRKIWPPEATPRLKRACIVAAPRGFRYRAIRSNEMRRLTRGLLRRRRGLGARIARLQAFLAALEEHATRMARRLDRIGPHLRLLGVAPPATSCLAQWRAAAPAHDTS